LIKIGEIIFSILLNLLFIKKVFSPFYVSYSCENNRYNGPEGWEYFLTTGSLNFGGLAHQRIGTSAHQHIGTSAHRHIGTLAYRHINQ